MKKFLLSLLAVILTCATASADEKTITFSSAPTNYSNFTLEGFTFGALKNNGSTAPTFNANNKDFRLYAQGTFEITAPEGATMQKVVFNLSTQGKKRLAPITATVGAIATQTSNDATVTWTGDDSNVKFTVGDKANYGSEGSSKAGQLCFSSVTITYTTGGKPSANLKFSAADVTAVFNEPFTAPTLTKDTDAAVTYESSDINVATVAEDGAVTLVGAGATTITAATAETAEYSAGSASYTLNVIKPISVAEALALCTSSTAGAEIYVKGIVTESKAWSTQYKNVDYNIADNTGDDETLLIYRGKWADDVVAPADNTPEVGATVIVKGRPKLYNDTKELDANNLIVSYVAPAKELGEVMMSYEGLEAPVAVGTEQSIELAKGTVVTFTAANATSIDVNGVLTEGASATYTVNADEIVIITANGTDAEGNATTAEAMIDIKALKPVVAAPVFTPADGTAIFGEATVTIACATEGAVIYYSVNDGDLTEYTAPISFTEDGTYTIEAFASADGYTDSDVVSATYTYTVKEPAKPVTVTFDFVNNDYGMTRLSGTTTEYNPDPVVFSDGWIGAVATGRNRLWSTKGFRVYAGAAITFYAPENTTVTSARVLSATGSEIAARTKEFTIEGNKAIYTCSLTSNNADLPQIEITYSATTEEEIVAAFMNSNNFTVKVGETVLTELTHNKSADADAVISLAHHYPHAAVYYKWEPAASGVSAQALEGYNAYTTPLNLATAGNLSFYAELNGAQTPVQTLTVTGETTTSISEINAAEADAEWFDLQGRRVADPVKGIYLKRQGNTTLKVRL